MLLEDAINEAVNICHEASFDAGWWADADGEPLVNNPMCFSQKLMLTVSELAEAMEADRKDLMDDKLPLRHGTEVELADAIIRIFDLAGAYSLDLGGAVVDKLAYNKIREDHKLENRSKGNGKRY